MVVSGDLIVVLQSHPKGQVALFKIEFSCLHMNLHLWYTYRSKDIILLKPQ